MSGAATGAMPGAAVEATPGAAAEAMPGAATQAMPGVATEGSGQMRQARLDANAPPCSLSGATRVLAYLGVGMRAGTGTGEGAAGEKQPRASARDAIMPLTSRSDFEASPEVCKPSKAVIVA